MQAYAKFLIGEKCMVRRRTADGNRLRILNLLFHGELCGCDIQYVLEASQSNISRHLTYLKNSGLVQDRRVGYRVYYRLSRSQSADHKLLFAYLGRAFKRALPFTNDLKKLKVAIKQGACSVSDPQAALSGRLRQQGVQKFIYS
jgi:ArsR family transcriptional regulator, arsenate/arsenite/antimonite-responsive transcriptional repressor